MNACIFMSAVLVAGLLSYSVPVLSAEISRDEQGRTLIYFSPKFTKGANLETRLGERLRKGAELVSRQNPFPTGMEWKWDDGELTMNLDVNSFLENFHYDLHLGPLILYVSMGTHYTWSHSRLISNFRLYTSFHIFENFSWQVIYGFIVPVAEKSQFGLRLNVFDRHWRRSLNQSVSIGITQHF